MSDLNEDTVRDARSDARYDQPLDEFAPATVDAPVWARPEGHEGDLWAAAACPHCSRQMSARFGGCYFCDLGCPNGCGRLDTDAFCVVCGATTWPSQHPALAPAVRDEVGGTVAAGGSWSSVGSAPGSSPIKDAGRRAA